MPIDVGEAAITPVITFRSPTSGVYPFTVFVSAENTNLQGLTPEEVTYIWNFGDSTPLYNGTAPADLYDNATPDFRNLKQKTNIIDPCNPEMPDQTGYTSRSINLSTDQRGPQAAYTYWHDNGGTSFTISLTIVHNGVSSTTTSTTINVSAPSYKSKSQYVAGANTHTLKLTVAPGGLTNTAFDYSDLNSALNYVNTTLSGSTASAYVELQAGYQGYENFPMYSTGYIAKSNVYVSVNATYPVTAPHANLYAANGPSGFAGRTAGTTVPLITLAAGITNVHFHSIGFGSILSVTGDPNGYEQSSPATSYLKAISISGSSPVQNVTFTQCRGINLRNFFDGISSYAKNWYFNQFQFGICYETSTFSPSNVSIVGSVFSNNPNTSQKLVSNNSKVFTLSGSNYTSFCFNNVLSNAASTETSVGVINHSVAHSCTGSFIYRNRFYQDSSNYNSGTRIDSNEFHTGGILPSIVYFANPGTTNGCVIVNNAFNQDAGTTAAGFFKLANENQIVSNLRIANNTCFANGNINVSYALWDFRPSSSKSITFNSIEMTRNILAENSLQCASNWMGIESLNDLSSYFTYSRNLAPVRRSRNYFACIGKYGVKTLRTRNEWESSFFEGILPGETSPPKTDWFDADDIKSAWSYSIDKSNHNSLSGNSFTGGSSYCSYNYYLSQRNFGENNVGCGIVYDSLSEMFPNASIALEDFDSTVTVTSRSRGESQSSCQNAYASLADPYKYSKSTTGNTASQPIVFQGSGSENFLKFDDRTTRAFRIKFDPALNSSYKFASFGRSSSNFIGTYTDHANVSTNLISISLTGKTISQLVTAINALNIPGTYAENLGCEHVSATSIKTQTINAYSASETDTTLGTTVITPIWVIVKAEGLTVGDYVKTDVSYEYFDNGYDITVTYTNDGPTGQTAGDIRQRMGSFYVDGIHMGQNAVVIDNRNTSKSVPVQNPTSNYNGSNLPITDKYSATTSLYNSNYGIGISLIYDFVNNERVVQENVSCFNGKTYTVGYDWELDYEETAITRRYDISEDYLRRDCVGEGETVNLTIAVRATRNPKEWVYTLEPYKTFFTEQYGEVRYAIDPRPIYPVFTSVQYSGSGLYYTTYNPNINGWDDWADRIRQINQDYAYDRILMWSPSGQYYNNNKLNYPSLMLSPLYSNDTSKFPHALSGTYSDSTLNGIVNGVGVSGTFTINSTLLQDTFPTFESAVTEIPSFGYYWGYGSVVHTKWNPGSTSDIRRAYGLTDSSVSQALYDEIDLAVYRSNVNILGMDAIAEGFASTKQIKNYIDQLNQRYPNLKLLVETSLQDYLILYASNYLFSDASDGVVQSPHHIADYITPGHEHCLFVYDADLVGEYGLSSDVTDEIMLYRLQNAARMGYVCGPVTQLSTGNLSAEDVSDFYAADRRFVYNIKPADVSVLFTPLGFSSTSYIEPNWNESFATDKKLMKITWNRNTESDFSHYEVAKCPVTNGIPNLNGTYQVKLYTKTNEFWDNQVIEDTTYGYIVTAVDVYGNRSQSEPYFAIYDTTERLAPSYDPRNSISYRAINGTIVNESEYNRRFRT